MHKDTISGLFPSLLAEEGRASLVVCGITQSVPLIYMHNIRKPCPATIIIIKKGKEKEKKTNMTLTPHSATISPSYFVIEKPCCARHSTSARIFSGREDEATILHFHSSPGRRFGGHPQTNTV